MMVKDIKPGYVIRHAMAKTFRLPDVETVDKVYVTREAVYINAQVYFPNSLLDVVSTGQ